MNKTIDDLELIQNISHIAEDMLKAVCEGISVVYQGITKNNGVVNNALKIINPDTPSLSPAIYIDNAVKRIKEGSSDIRTEAANITNIYKDQLDIMPKYSDVRKYFKPENFFVAVVNSQVNEERLKETVYTDINDLSVVLRCKMADDASFEVRHEQLGSLKISSSEAIDIGIKNTIASGSEVVPMEQMLINLLGMDSGAAFFDDILDEAVHCTPPHMYVITGHTPFGAAQPFIDKDLRKRISDLMPSHDYVLLPSSIFECIALDVNDTVDAEGLISIVKEVNTQLDPKDILSDSIYYVSGDSLSIKAVNMETLLAKDTVLLDQSKSVSLSI